MNFLEFLLAGRWFKKWKESINPSSASAGEVKYDALGGWSRKGFAPLHLGRKKF